VNNEETVAIAYTGQVSGCARFKSCPGWMNRWLAVDSCKFPFRARQGSRNFDASEFTIQPPYPDNRATELVRKDLSFVRPVSGRLVSFLKRAFNFAMNDDESASRSGLRIGLFISI